MRTKCFFDYVHAHRYLSGSVILYDGQPVYVMECFGEGDELGAVIRKVGRNWRQDSGRIMFNDPLVDMTPIPLGMCNYTISRGEEGDHNATQALVLKRAPVRAWKVGLTKSNLRVRSAEGNPSIAAKESLITSQSLTNMVNSKYPPLKEAMLKTDDESTLSFAFSRNFALAKEGEVFHTMTSGTVGVWRSDDGITLDNRFKFLQEQLNKEIGL